MSEFVNCQTCKTDCVRADGNYGYTFCDRHTKPKQTNADHIRSMTDEELADYISENCISDFCYIVCGGDCKAMANLNKTSAQVCQEIVSNWLKQPYKETT